MRNIDRRRHVIEVFEGHVVESDYSNIAAGEQVHMARCLCGWSVVRRAEFETREEVASHRERVA